MFKWPFRKSQSQTMGNDHSGDLTLRNQIIHIERVDRNWVYGFVPGLNSYFAAKVHATPSRERDNPFREVGINSGRISRLWISTQSGKEAAPIVNYGNGIWLTAPRSAKAKVVVNELISCWA